MMNFVVHIVNVSTKNLFCNIEFLEISVLKKLSSYFSKDDSFLIVILANRSYGPAFYIYCSIMVMLCQMKCYIWVER